MNDGKICVSVCAETAEEMIVKIRSVEKFADVVEVRFDCLDPHQLSIFRSQMPDLKREKPLLATFRSPEQGGNGSAALDERIRFWSEIGGDIWALDLEEDIVTVVDCGGIRIASQHDFSGEPADLQAIFERLASCNCDVIKLAVTANDITDSITVWKLLEKARILGKQMIPIAMGEAGKWTRILGLAHGAFLTYASLDAGIETAPGQVTGKDLVDLYRVRELDRETKIYGILGNPISQSLSPYLHNPAFFAEGINAVFIPFLVGNIDEFMRRMVRRETREVDLNFGGFAVTMPHKESIMKHLDAIDPIAERIGAVNTVSIDGDGKLTGHNTDAYGFITPLIANYGDLSGARVAVLGGGGAARACVHSLKKEGAEVGLFVRDVERARALADEFAISIAPISDLTPEISGPEVTGQKPQPRPDRFDIIIDTTPIGMAGSAVADSLLTANDLKGVKFVYDLVTKTYDTPIIREAKKAGIPAIGGIEMLIAQGVKQFEIWTGKRAPAELMRASLLDRFAEVNK